MAVESYPRVLLVVFLFFGLVGDCWCRKYLWIVLIGISRFLRGLIGGLWIGRGIVHL